MESLFQQGKTRDQSQNYGALGITTCFLLVFKEKRRMWVLFGFLSLSICRLKIFLFFFIPNNLRVGFIFKFLMPGFSPCSPSPCLLTVITSLILVMLVNGSPVCPPPSSPALPPLKLPVGYYRDVFINAVYDSLSTLSLAAVTSPFSTPIFPSPLKWDLSFYSFFLLSVCLTALSFICPLRSVLLPFLSFLFVEISLFC